MSLYKLDWENYKQTSTQSDVILKYIRDSEIPLMSEIYDCDVMVRDKSIVNCNLHKFIFYQFCWVKGMGFSSSRIYKISCM